MRGIAIIAMITFHIVFDLQYFGIFKVNVNDLSWIIFRDAIFSSFFLLVGISLTLSYSKSRPFSHFLLRGIKIFCWGLLITIATLLFLNQGFIYFGVLHFIGVSIVISYPFLKLKNANLIFAFIIFGLWLLIANFTLSFPWLLWLGLKPHIFYSLDYFPLIPYFAIILIGIFLGNTFYKNHKRQYKLPELNIKPIEFLGKNALVIYLIHQPLIILFISLFKYFF